MDRLCVSFVCELRVGMSLILLFTIYLVYCFTVVLQLFVHCVSGVSRAPTMVIAWLIKCKKLALWDAFQYVSARRSLVFPNFEFRYQLTLYEIDQGFGSSVKQREEFACYEFHTLQVKTLVFRRRVKGLLSTTLDLYRKPKYVSNLNL